MGAIPQLEGVLVHLLVSGLGLSPHRKAALLAYEWGQEIHPIEEHNQ